jgi:hypothetical protein
VERASLAQVQKEKVSSGIFFPCALGNAPDHARPLKPPFSEGGKKLQEDAAAVKKISALTFIWGQCLTESLFIIAIFKKIGFLRRQT